MEMFGLLCGTQKYRVASDISLADFANRPKNGKAWIDDLPDDVFNQIWDARHEGTVGKELIANWLHSIGYADATPGRVETVMFRGRR